MTASLRLADLLAGLSLVTDLGMGLPPEDAMRTCLLGTALARKLGLAESVVGDVFFTSLLQHIGCTGYAHETYLVWIDDVAANRAAQRTNFAEPMDLFRAYLPTLTRGMGVAERARIAARFAIQGPGFLKRFASAACEVSKQVARRLGLSEGIQRALHQYFEWWNGKGAPKGLRGEDIAIASRVAFVAGVASKFEGLGGAQLAMSAVRRRAGTILDPAIASVFVSHAPELLESLTRGDPREQLLEAEPQPACLLLEPQLPDVASIFGDVADLKNPFTHGHSAAVAWLARAAGERLGLDRPILERLHVASLLHDLGSVGVSDAIWEKPGKLTMAEWEQIRLHAYHSERILSRSPVLQPMASLAGMHHERLDGSGYHRGCKAGQVPMAVRILSAADVMQAMMQGRPHREARGVNEAADEMRREAAAGRLDSDAVRAVVDAAGGPPSKRISARPAGLTDREIDVIRLVADGHSNRQIGERLHISTRTAGHHIQHIYDKIGVSSRAAAAMFAMEHGLIPMIRT